MHSSVNLKLIKAHWEDSDTISLKDINLQQLERYYILEFLKKIKMVDILADIGCGDGIDTEYWCNFAKEVIGFDYSYAMIKKANKNLNGKARIFQFDLLKDNFAHAFNVAITKRCLINLKSFKNQKKAILKIHRCIRKGGYYIMLECSKDGLNNLNSLRAGVNLDPINEPFHNTYFNMPLMIRFLQRYFIIKELKYFSLYYFLTRVYSQFICQKNYEKFDSIAKKLHLMSDIFTSDTIGPQFFMVLKKK